MPGHQVGADVYRAARECNPRHAVEHGEVGVLAKRKTRYYLAELHDLGYDVIITPRADADGEAAGTPPAA
jgi:hypothetical protein